MILEMVGMVGMEMGTMMIMFRIMLTIMFVNLGRVVP